MEGMGLKLISLVVSCLLGPLSMFGPVPHHPPFICATHDVTTAVKKGAQNLAVLAS